MSIREGLLSGGGLGENLEYRTETFEYYGYRIFFDLSYFIIITIIALNVVFGIIVDTFSEVYPGPSEGSKPYHHTG